MGAFDDAPHVEPEGRDGWRGWLEANHALGRGVWLVMPSRAAEQRDGFGYEAAVEEALCFGWVDSRGGAVDGRRTKLYFAPRKARSGWSAPNKERVARLEAAGRMAPAGRAAVERARADGSWNVLDGPARGEVPEDLRAALDAQPPARQHWDAWPPGLCRNVLAWIALARRPETRRRRIAETVRLAERNERPKR